MNLGSWIEQHFPNKLTRRLMVPFLALALTVALVAAGSTASTSFASTKRPKKKKRSAEPASAPDYSEAVSALWPDLVMAVDGPLKSWPWTVSWPPTARRFARDRACFLMRAGNPLGLHTVQDLGDRARAGHPCYFQEAGARAQYLDTLSMLTPPDATFTKLDRFRRTRRTGCL